MLLEEKQNQKMYQNQVVSKTNSNLLRDNSSESDSCSQDGLPISGSDDDSVDEEDDAKKAPKKESEKKVAF